MGDSAGGGLALLLLQELAKNKPYLIPIMGILGSPWTDLSISGESNNYNSDLDFILYNFNRNKSRPIVDN